MKNLNKFKNLCFVFLCLLAPFFSHAQSGGLSLSVTPTLFQMSAVPEQSWSSGVKVINNNPYELTVYAQVVNFAPQGETGEGKFLPVFEKATEGTTLAEWVTLSSEPVVIAAEQSAVVPFSVFVPKEAAPGGHFAAILIGTKPPESTGVVRVSTSQIVTSLFFVRIAGDIEEQGSIREFGTLDSFVDTPKADFEVRFENKGNVHLQPQGEIVITNMWGKERGVIPINHQTHFGNVLPQSIRKFEFSWKGEQSFSDIGRYKAVITLAYGEQAKKFETAVEYFYVIPVKASLIVLSVLIALVLLVRWSVKAYIRKMLALSGIDPFAAGGSLQKRNFEREGDVRIVRRGAVQAPITLGLSDFSERLSSARAYFEKLKAIVSFVYAYRIFFVCVVGILILSLLSLYFVKDAITEKRDYEVVIENPDTSVTLSSEDIIYNAENENVKVESDTKQTFTLILKNSSNVPGAAAKLQPELEALGYTVSDLQSDFVETKKRSVIVYSAALSEQALDLSQKLGGVLLSSDAGTSTSEAAITVYIGNDLAERE
jgi:hypothetical protein